MRALLAGLLAAATAGSGAWAASADPEVPENAILDVAYGSDPLQELDIYAPDDADTAPVMIFLHGGAWQIGDKSLVGHKPAFFNEAGWVFVSANFRVSRDNPDPETQAYDVGAAVTWVSEQIATYGGDPDRIFLMGHSSGAHLAALVALSSDYGVTDGMVDGVVLLDGAAYDVNKRIEDAAMPRARDMLLRVFGDDPARREVLSPTLRTQERNSVPAFFVIHVAGREASTEQSEALAGALGAVGADAKLLAAEGFTHGSLNKELGLDNEVTEALSKWMDEIAAAE